MAGTALGRNCRRPGRRRPVTLVAAIAFAGAWLRGWPPARLWRAAAWSLPMTGVYLAGRALQARTWRALALAPVHDWERAWHLAQAGHVIRAFVLCVPAGVPAAFCAAGTAWAWRIYAIETGISGKTATAPVIFDARQWCRQARTARARITAPGTVPLTDGDGGIVMGARPSAPSGTAGTHADRSVRVDGTTPGRPGRVRVRQDQSDDADVGRLVCLRPHRPCGPRRCASAADRAGLQRRPRRPGQSRPHPPPAPRCRGRPGRRTC
jgi:hypothetical protein